MTARTEQIEYQSDGLRISGILHHPASPSSSGGAPAFMVLHGFGGTKQGAGSIATAEHLAERGYAALRIDFRGCGESEGERGLVLCLDQVSDTRNGLSYLQSRDDVDGRRLGVIGASFGAAVAVYSAGVDERIGATISIGGWGDGERKFRRQHASPEAWEKFSTMLEEGGRRAARGERMMVARFDIVPIPPHLRNNLAAGAHTEFPWEVARSMYDFRADEVVGRIAPRPLLLIHASNDSVTPTQESVEMFLRAGQPTDLHLFAEVDHFLSAEKESRATSVLDSWLARYFPAR
ncbi:MAG: alpha/beta hydrolase [Chloroflexota bacterium]